MCETAYSSHPPVVVVLIFISWLYERKGAVVASHVTCQADQHLQQITGGRSLFLFYKFYRRYVNLNRSVDLLLLFQEEGEHQRRRSC